MKQNNNSASGYGSNNIMSSSLPASSFMSSAQSNKTTTTGNVNNISSGLTFERKDATKLTLSTTTTSSNNSSPVKPTPRPKKKRVFSTEGSTFWKLLVANKQYLTSCMDAQKTICIPPDEEVDYVLYSLKYSGTKLQGFISKYVSW